MIFPSLIGFCFPALTTLEGVPGALRGCPVDELDAVASEMKVE